MFRLNEECIVLGDLQVATAPTEHHKLLQMVRKPLTDQEQVLSLFFVHSSRG